jgi:endonuclease G
MIENESAPINGPVVSNGTATWTIPLTVSVSVGNPATVAPTTGIPATPRAIRSTAAGQSQSEPSSTGAFSGTLSDADVSKLKLEIERASSQTYYDADKDAEDRKAYYADISSTLGPDQLFTALSQLVSKTHKNKLGYSPSQHLYPWVDLHDDLMIHSIYSGEKFAPLEFIQRDQEVAGLRLERLAGFRATESAGDPIAEAVMLEALESQLPFNCEHVVPQSWFGKKQPMKGDLHHLFACESKCNSFRSNTPYFDFADFREAVRSDCGKSVSNKFEPNAGKGPVARATLYFLLRYPGQINNNQSEYTPDRLQTLLQWHKDHPVTDYERHRNQAIFEVQGNRNPLIDFLELGSQIALKGGLG